MRHTLPLRGAGGATPEQIEDVVDIMLGECEYCFPAIYQVAQGQLSANDAAAAALFPLKVRPRFYGRAPNHADRMW